MTTTGEAAPRAVARGRVAVVAAVAVAVGLAQFWYGNRHNYYDLHIYDEAVRWWAAGHPLYSFSHLDRVQGPLGFTYPPFPAGGRGGAGRRDRGRPRGGRHAADRRGRAERLVAVLDAHGVAGRTGGAPGPDPQPGDVGHAAAPGRPAPAQPAALAGAG